MKKIYIVIGTIIFIIIGIFFYFNNEEDTITVEVKDEEIEKKEEEKIVIETNDCYVDVKGEVVNPGVYECVKNDKVIDLINKAGGLTKNSNTNIINLSKVVTNQMLIIVYSNRQIEDAKARLNQPTVIEIIKEIEKECICIDDVNDACEFTEENNDKENVNEKPSNSKVNINTATLEELMTLSKIGEAKAKSIIEYRKENVFKSIEEIKNISGIGDSIFESIKDFIEV